MKVFYDHLDRNFVHICKKKQNTSTAPEKHSSSIEEIAFPNKLPEKMAQDLQEVTISFRI